MDDLGRWVWFRVLVAAVGVVLTTIGLGEPTGAGVVYAAPVLAPYVVLVRSRAGAVLVGALALIAARVVGTEIGGLGPEGEAMGGGVILSFAALVVVLGPALVDLSVVAIVGRLRR